MLIGIALSIWISAASEPNKNNVMATSSARSQIVPFVPDPRTPMPAEKDWKDPGYLKLVWIQSPNFDHRQKTEVFQRSASNPVSAHFTIGKDGSIVQNVSTFERAWHAGVSKDAGGRPSANQYSIGIELVNLDDGKDGYPEPQLQALCGIIAEMKRRFPIKQIVSHEFIAIPPGRKIDPAAFPWKRLAYFGLPMYYGQNKS